MLPKTLELVTWPSNWHHHLLGKLMSCWIVRNSYFYFLLVSVFSNGFYSLLCLIQPKGQEGVEVTCENGLCRPDSSDGYTDTCKAICGESSCKDAILPVNCDLRKHKKFSSKPLNGHLALCFNGWFSLSLNTAENITRCNSQYYQWSKFISLNSKFNLF